MPTPAETWDLLLFVILLPLVVLMGSQLPGDWANHHGQSFSGTATVSAFESVRGADAVLVDVRNETGRLIATRQEVNGDAPHRLGATFRVRYLPVDAGGITQVYSAGHDPFDVNVAVFVPCLLLWLISVPFVVARLLRLGKRASARRRRRLTGPYRAGNGYTHN